MIEQQIDTVEEASRGAQDRRGERGAKSWVDRAAEAEAWERQHEAEWERLDQKLRGISARRAVLDAEEAHLLRYAEEIKLWRYYGFGSLLEYMERAMGYAPHTAAERLRVARAIGELPLLAEALENSELAHSAVRELSRVAVPETEGDWLEAARGKSLREIEAMVSGHKPGDLPTDATEPRLHRKTITIEVSPETYDLWRRMHALAAEEHGQRLSDDELIQSVFRRAYVRAVRAVNRPAYLPTRSRSSNAPIVNVAGSTAVDGTSRSIRPWPSARPAMPSTSARSMSPRRSGSPRLSRSASGNRCWREMATAARCLDAGGTSGSICITSSFSATAAVTSLGTSRSSARFTTAQSTSESS